MRRGDLADALRLVAGNGEQSVPEGVAAMPASPSSACSASACGLRTRTLRPRGRSARRARPRATKRPRLMITTRSTVCATSASTWLETSDRAAAGRGEGAQEVAQPADALRVEPVRRLVEHEQLRVAEQRGREPEPLAHAERVALHPPSGRILELDEAEHLLHATPRMPAAGARERRWSRPLRPGWKSVASRTAPTRSAASGSCR